MFLSTFRVVMESLVGDRDITARSLNSIMNFASAAQSFEITTTGEVSCRFELNNHTNSKGWSMVMPRVVFGRGCCNHRLYFLNSMTTHSFITRKEIIFSLTDNRISY